MVQYARGVLHHTPREIPIPMLLLVNIDDISGELIPHAIDNLMALGADSVHVVPAITKKGRMEYLFFIDSPAERVEELADYLACELGTLGVRAFEPHHISFAYRFCQVRLELSGGIEAQVRVKQLLDGDGQVLSVKAEADDLQAAVETLGPAVAHLSFKALKNLVESVVQTGAPANYKSIRASVDVGVNHE